MPYKLISEMSDGEFASEAASTVGRIIARIEAQRSVTPPKTPEMARKQKVNPGKFSDEYFKSDYDYTLDRMTDMVFSASHNLDRLRVFDQFLVSQPDLERADAVLRTAIVLTQCFGGDIAGLMTQEHMERLLAYEDAFRATPDNVFPNPAHQPILHFVNALKQAAVAGDEDTNAYIRDNLHAVGALMVERKIYRYENVLGLVTAMNNSSPSLMNGAL